MIPRIFLIILGMLGAIGASAAELTDKEKAMIRESVKANLKDPDSARFKWLPIADNQIVADGAILLVYCGVVNSKNSFGGYVGDVPYQVALVKHLNSKDTRAASIVIAIGSGGWNSSSSKAIIDVCYDKGYTNFMLAK